MKKTAIIGLGLMGASLGIALRQSRLGYVYGYARRAETRAQALERGICDEVFDSVSGAVENADLVVLCLPVLAMRGIVQEFSSALRRDAVVTDVGSTKEEICEEISSALKGKAVFVGSHPMAGSDETGIDAARENLYKNAVVIVTPAKGSTGESVDMVAGFWRELGARVSVMEPDVHDRIIARTSHLPHLVAAMLVASVLGDSAEALKYCGSGFRDTTRIAGGSEDIWHDIVKSNSRAVLDELDKFAELLDDVRNLIKKGEFEKVRAFLAEARKMRRKLQKESGR